MKEIKNKINLNQQIIGFSIIEVIIIISIISLLVTVAAPSLFSTFRQQYLKLNTNQITLDIQKIQSDSYLEHRFHKVQFEINDNSYSTWVENNNSWNLIKHQILENQTIRYDTILDNTLSIVYGPNGHAYLCNKNSTSNICKQNKLVNSAKIAIISDTKEIIIQFLPFNGFVSSNYSIK